MHFILAVADVGVLSKFALTRLQHAGINRAFRRCKVHGKKVRLNADSGEVFSGKIREIFQSNHPDDLIMVFWFSHVSPACSTVLLEMEALSDGHHGCAGKLRFPPCRSEQRSLGGSPGDGPRRVMHVHL